MSGCKTDNHHARPSIHHVGVLSLTLWLWKLTTVVHALREFYLLQTWFLYPDFPRSSCLPHEDRRTHARAHTSTHARTRAHTRVHTHARACTHAHVHACTRTNAHTHTPHTHTHTHTHSLHFDQIPGYILASTKVTCVYACVRPSAQKYLGDSPIALLLWPPC